MENVGKRHQLNRRLHHKEDVAVVHLVIEALHKAVAHHTTDEHEAEPEQNRHYLYLLVFCTLIIAHYWYYVKHFFICFLFNNRPGG